MMVAAISASAQARFAPETITLQPRIGGTGSIFTNAPDVISHGQTIEPTAAGGGFLGLDVEYYLSTRLSLAAGVNKSGAGTGWKSHNWVSSGINMETKEMELRTSYINVPMTINWYVLKGFALKAGVQLGFLTNADEYSRTTYSQDGVDYTILSESDAKDSFNKFDFSIPVGISYEFKCPLVIDLRYNIGMTKVNKNNMLDGKDYRNLQAVLTLGYKFEL